MTTIAQQLHVENVKRSAAALTAALAGRAPKLAIVLGSGLGGLAERVEQAVTLTYSELPGFPVLTVQGHTGALVAGKLNGVDVVVLKGRKHFYETDDPYPLKTMVRTLRAVGVEVLFLSNAAGSLRAPIGVSQLMLITDHINALGLNPLTGANDETFGPRFFGMSDAWDAALSEKISQAAIAEMIPLHRGVYLALRGPSFETPAEIRMIKEWGADAVGMSSVPECLIARHCGMKVVGVSCITNMGAGLSDEKLSHEHTLANAAKGAADFERLVLAAVPRLAGA
ncbi:MAG: purine-nucleoside phosphorylase [Opitutia bacterium]|nr:MAG: purine-nucleoside phosphorylase [Opitutae bacterium]